jgi:hypothetical protein
VEIFQELIWVLLFNDNLWENALSYKIMNFADNEGEAIKGSLDSGHNTSAMTNLSLEHHLLVPNRALRSAIPSAISVLNTALTRDPRLDAGAASQL